MGRQIVNTQGSGMAAAEARRAGLLALVVAIAVLVLFWSLNASGVGDRSWDRTHAPGVAGEAAPGAGGAGQAPASK